MVEQWNRHAELELLLPSQNIFRHSHAFWAGKLHQVPEYGEQQREFMLSRLGWFERELGTREYIAGHRFTVADITAMCAIDFARISKVRLDPEAHPNLTAWHARVAGRPSSKA